MNWKESSSDSETIPLEKDGDTLHTCGSEKDAMVKALLHNSNIWSDIWNVSYIVDFEIK